MCLDIVTTVDPSKLPRTRIGYKIVDWKETPEGRRYAPQLYASSRWTATGWTGPAKKNWIPAARGGSYPVGVHAYTSLRGARKVLEIDGSPPYWCIVKVRLTGPLAKGKQDGVTVVVYQNMEIIQEEHA